MSNIYDALNKGKEPEKSAAPATPGESRALPGAALRSDDNLELIRQRVLLEVGPDRNPVVVFTGAVPGEGTSTLALRFAREIALTDPRPVLLIDGDLARSRGSLSGALEAGEETHGLSELLAGQGELARLVLGTEQANLHFLPCGRGGVPPLELVKAERVGRLVKELTRLYAFVVIDAGASLLAPETAIFASSTDGVILVVRANRTRREVVQKAIEVLHKARCRLLGVVLNDRRYPIPGFLYRRI
jgi:capsular exopolysaccharide synthesis family protein